MGGASVKRRRLLSQPMASITNLKPEYGYESKDLAEIITNIAIDSRSASRVLSKASTSSKNGALKSMAEGILEGVDFIIAENAKDLDELKRDEVTNSYVDRLTLTPERVRAMAAGLVEVAGLADPVGEITKMWKRPNGLEVGRMRLPLGVIGIIYEARPNVTADAAGLCLKAGNSVILRGGSDSLRSNLAIGAVLKAALEKHDLPAEAITIVPVPQREAVTHLIQLDELIDLIIPRGGEGLIRFVAENSRVPVLKHYKGICHVFVDESADLDMALDIALNSKVQRPGVCNAMETLLVHSAVAEGFIPVLAERMTESGVELRGCERSAALDPRISRATEQDWHEEYLDLILSIRVVDGITEAIDHIETYGSMHTEAIVTRDYTNSRRFISEVGSSTVLVNASTRFSDGQQLGLGAEIGISTSKLHAFGPMGLEELTSQKFIVYGEGQVRD